MRIQSRIWATTVAAVAVSTIITFFVFSILQDMSDDLARSRRYNDVINEAFELSILVDSFGEGSSQRDTQQVNDVRKTFSELLANLSSSNVREDYLIRQIRRNNQELGPLLDQFFDQREVLGSDLETERKNMLASQLRKAAFSPSLGKTNCFPLIRSDLR